MKIDKSIFRWSHHSDQPAQIERRVKRSLRRAGIRNLLSERLSASLLLLRYVRGVFVREEFRPWYNKDCIGLCMNLERPFANKRILSASDLREIVEPLELSRIAIRIPLHDVENLQDYVDFMNHFSDFAILAVILQDRDFIEDRERLRTALRSIFTALSGLVDGCQIGNAVNRLKWGFVTRKEYFEFFRIAWNLRNEEFPALKLLGGAVIDFEPLDHCSVLHHRFPFRYDGYASLLYVDRRGAPENRQMGFDLRSKIALLCRIMHDSGQLDAGDGRLWITEVNWPLRDTGRYAPALDDSRVGEREQLFFLVRYYLLALSTGSVAACFWHQLVAPGYGLIDNRGGVVRKRPAFHGFATLCRLFNGAYIEGFNHQTEQGHYELVARKDGVEVRALWCCGRVISVPMPAGKRVVNIEGEALEVKAGQSLAVSDSVVYLVDDRAPYADSIIAPR